MSLDPSQPARLVAGLLSLGLWGVSALPAAHAQHDTFQHPQVTEQLREADDCSLADMMAFDEHYTSLLGRVWLAIADQESRDAMATAAEAGDSQVMFEYGLTFAYHDREPDFDQALIWLRRAAEQDHAGAQAEIGGAYLNGFMGLAPDIGEAEAWLQDAAANGDALAAYALSAMYGQLIRHEMPVGFTEEIAYLAESAAACYPLALRDIAMRSLVGDGIEQNRSRAVQLSDRLEEYYQAGGQVRP